MRRQSMAGPGAGSGGGGKGEGFAETKAKLENLAASTDQIIRDVASQDPAQYLANVKQTVGE